MFEASVNIDKATIKPLLMNVLSIFDDDFGDSHVSQLISFYEAVPENEKDMISLVVTYNGQKQELVFVVKDDCSSKSIYFFSDEEAFTNNISCVFREFFNEIGA